MTAVFQDFFGGLKEAMTNVSGGINGFDRDFLSDFSDEELARRCSESDSAVSYTTELIFRYFGFIKSKAAQMCFVPSSYDDFVQEGLLGFLNAVRCFDPEKGERFAAFARVCVINRMISAGEKLNRMESGAEENEESIGDSATPENIIIRREMVGELKGMLSSLEYEALCLYAAGLEKDEIAGRLGITPKAADNALTRARKKARGKMGDGSSE